MPAIRNSQPKNARKLLPGMPYPEIAHMLGVSEGTVQSRRTAAIEWLRDNLR